MREKQQEIIAELNTKPTINPEAEIAARTAFLGDYLAATGLKGFALGISGGQDSLLAGLLAQRAAHEHGATFHAVLLPYGEQADRHDAEAARDFIQPDVTHDLNIKATVDSFEQTFNTADHNLLQLRDFDKGNVKARVRMIAQYALAGNQNLLVVGTDHAAEAVTGFFTKFGDGSADVLPLSGLTKRQGKQLLRELGAPEHLITKAPTADLLDGKPGQADEAELDLRYDDIDDYLEGKEVDPTIAEKIEQRFEATRHKRTVPVAYEE